MANKAPEKSLAEERRRHFYDGVLARIRGKRPDILSYYYQSSESRAWVFFTTDHPHINLGSSFSGPKKLLVTLTIFGAAEDVTHALFHELEKHRKAIEAQLDTELTWKVKPGVATCRIEVGRPGPDLSTQKEYTEAADWTADMLIKFSDTFRPYIEGP